MVHNWNIGIIGIICMIAWLNYLHNSDKFIFTPIVLNSLNSDIEVCPVYYLKSYLRRTKTIRSVDSLFVCVNKPHGQASSSTISRWLINVISQSGQMGTAGSTRSTVTSTALAKGVAIQTVIKSGDWSRVRTFRNFYYKPVPLSHLQTVFTSE